ncbi:MAG: UDP-glucose 4-epimerase GalE [Cypionkella sp.]
MTSGIAVLVTGGAGFIGSHACKALKSAGLTPVAFDNLSTGHARAVRFGPLVQGDVRDAGAVAAALREHDARAIIHFAASAYVGESMRDPGLYYDNNLGGMIGLLKGAGAAGVDKIVFSSSCATYGIPVQLPIAEDCPQLPINPYGRTKLVCELMLRDHAAAHGLRFAALRYFNAAGADLDGVLGEHHDPETHLIPLALRAAAGQAPLQVFGTDYPTPDGTCIRDYIHVVDLARAHVLAVARLLGGGDSLAVNLGTGQGLSIRQIIAGIEVLTGSTLPVQWGPRRPGDPPSLTADPALAFEKLGFKTESSDLATILRSAAPWFEVSLAH